MPTLDNSKKSALAVARVNPTKETEDNVNLFNKAKQTALFSYQTCDDIVSLLMGFQQMCCHKFKQRVISIVPSCVNSDMVENIFCPQRVKFNGSNTNPTYLQYCNTMNSIILGQSTKSQKSNALHHLHFQFHVL